MHALRDSPRSVAARSTSAKRYFGTAIAVLCMAMVSVPVISEKLPSRLVTATEASSRFFLASHRARSVRADVSEPRASHGKQPIPHLGLVRWVVGEGARIPRRVEPLEQRVDAGAPRLQ